MKVRVIVQSRLSSSRLPGKALLTLGGRPLIVLAAQRAANTGLDVVVATSVEREDDALAAALETAGVAVFRGDLHNTLGRFVAATAGLADDDLVVRLTGDNVGPDGAYVEGLIGVMRDAGHDYVRVTTDTVYGLGAEVCTVGLLRAADRAAESAYDREHVTPWIRRHTDDFTWVPPVSGPASRVRCTVDTLLDFTIATRALQALADPVTAGWRELLDAWVAAGADAGEQLPGAWTVAGDFGAMEPARASRVLERAALTGATHVRVVGAASADRVGRALGHGLSERVGVVAELPVGLPNGASAAVWEILARLGSSVIDVVVVDSPFDLIDAGSTLLRHRDEGRVRSIGCCAVDEDELAMVLADPGVDQVEVPFALLDSVVPATADRGMAVRCPDLASAIAALRHPAVTGVVLTATSAEEVDALAAGLRSGLSATGSEQLEASRQRPVLARARR